MKNKHKIYTGPVQAAIFDFSGTVVDAHVIAPTESFVRVFEKYGIRISVKQARKPMGFRKDLDIGEILKDNDVIKQWKNKYGSVPGIEEMNKMFEDFVPIQLECLPKYSKLIPGTMDTVNYLRGNDCKIGMTTGFTKVMTDILLEHCKPQGYEPDECIAGDMIPNMGFRPAPFMIYENLNRLGVYPIQSVVKVDDTASGIYEGINAGCWTVGVYNYSNYTDIDTLEQWDSMDEYEKKTRQEASKHILKNSGAHYAIPDVGYLPGVIDDINHRLLKGDKP